MNAAKVTLTSTILAAALGLALGLSAAPGNSYACHKDGAFHGNQTDCNNGGGGGGGGGGGAIVYTAELTLGAFVFHPFPPGHVPDEDEEDAHVVVVTPNQRENVLRSETSLNLDIDDTIDGETWADMFATCEELWEAPVEDFFVGADDWSIDKAGGVRVVFRHIEDQGAEFRFQLIGNEFDFIDSFLPTTDEDDLETRTYILDHFAITAKSLAGGSGGTKFCRTLGGEFGNPLPLIVDSVLTITATAPAP